jgi:uncharacterized membrane protein YtjA (UPF0391 family)
MFSWAIAFLIIALIAGALGVGVVAGTAFAAAKIIFIHGPDRVPHIGRSRVHPPRSAVDSEEPGLDEIWPQ